MMDFEDILRLFIDSYAQNFATNIVVMWYNWLVFFGFAISFMLLLLIGFQYIVRPIVYWGSHEQFVFNGLTWLIIPELLFILPSLLIRIAPTQFVNLLIVTDSLQNLGADTQRILVTILFWMAWVGITGWVIIVILTSYLFFRLIWLVYSGKNLTTGFSSYPSPFNINLATPDPKSRHTDEGLTPLPTQEDIDGTESETNTDNNSENGLTPPPPDSLLVTAWLLVVDYKGSESLFPLLSSTVKVGHGAFNDIVLAKDRYISEHHATITYEDENFLLIDNSRHNATWVGSLPLKKRREVILRDGDMITFGTSKFYFYTVPWPKITVSSSEMAEKSYQQQLPIHIGSNYNNHIVLQDSEIIGHYVTLDLDYLKRQFILKPETDDYSKIVIGKTRATDLDKPPWIVKDPYQFEIGPYKFDLKV